MGEGGGESVTLTLTLNYRCACAGDVIVMCAYLLSVCGVRVFVVYA